MHGESGVLRCTKQFLAMQEMVFRIQRIFFHANQECFCIKTQDQLNYKSQNELSADVASCSRRGKYI